METSTYISKSTGAAYKIQYGKTGFWVMQESRVLAWGGRLPLMRGDPLSDKDQAEKILLLAQDAIEKGDFFSRD